VRTPFLFCELVLAVAAQLTTLLAVVAVTQAALELVFTGAQLGELGLIQIAPDEAAAVTLKLVVLKP
jgi:hypothetical protein